MILIIIVSVIAFFILFKLAKWMKHIVSSKNRIAVSQQYYCKEGDFTILGYKDKFSICKDGKLEFLIRDGQIVAAKDLRVNDEFVYYGGKNVDA